MKKNYFFILVSFALAIWPASFLNAQGGVSVNVAGTPPDSSALFDVSGTNKGLLMPRMTTVQRNAIPNPATGLTIYNTDCGVYNYNAGTTANPNWVTLNSTNALVAAVSIAASPVGAICAGTIVTFVATPASGINSPGYQWKVNGNSVGTNSPAYTDSTLNTGDVVTCVLSTNEACVTGSPATSNSITVTVNAIPSTPGSISGNANACANSSGNVYSISPVAGATSYNWTVPNGASIASGSGTTSITVTFGVDSGTISVVAFSSCGTSGASSLTVAVNPPAPATPGAISGSASVDTGTGGHVYSISPVNNATTYTWTVPADAIITAGQGTTSITVTFGVDSGNISVTAGNSCGTSSANSIAISVVPCAYVPGSQTFSYTGSQQTYTVPCGVTSITIQCWGAQGQNEYGGLGGYATGNLAVATGQQLYVYVGGQNDYNGGGVGNAGNGGGGTDVRQGGSTLNNRIIVAGGGGGAYGNNGPGYAGGSGGGATGGASVYSNNGNPAQGGTQNAGGNWGGSFGQGAASDNEWAGSGGGGGWYGGGANNTTYGSPISNSAGGGGSGYIGGVSNGTMENGIQSGNGQVIISW